MCARYWLTSIARFFRTITTVKCEWWSLRTQIHLISTLMYSNHLNIMVLNGVFTVTHENIWNWNPSLPKELIPAIWVFSTLFQEIKCCLTVPSHYLNQCWLIISDLLRHSLWGYFIKKSLSYLSVIWVSKLLIQDYCCISHRQTSWWCTKAYFTACYLFDLLYIYL